MSEQKPFLEVILQNEAPQLQKWAWHTHARFYKQEVSSLSANKPGPVEVNIMKIKFKRN